MSQALVSATLGATALVTGLPRMTVLLVVLVAMFTRDEPRRLTAMSILGVITKSNSTLRALAGLPKQPKNDPAE